MAICKILSIKDTGSSYSGRHLKVALEYIVNSDKTEEQILVGAVHVSPTHAYEQMCMTKNEYGKNSGRQGYHIIISFKEGETDGTTALEIAEEFAQEYLSDYEAVYAVHVNTDYTHIHIIFNSVSFRNGKKYRYEKGDWEREILPIMNRLCKQHGLSTLDLDQARAEGSQKARGDYEYRDYGDWNDMIRRDVDITIAKASTFEDFITIMEERGYEIKKENKYLAMRPPGMTRWRRLKTMGSEYTEERIRQRIQIETIDTYRMESFEESERIVYSRIPRGKRAKLTPLQKQYYARLYRTGMLIRRPYSRVWKYKDEIKKFHALQKQYLYLCDHEISSVSQIQSEYDSLVEQGRIAGKEKRKACREQKKSQTLFDLFDSMTALYKSELLYQKGNMDFMEEHELWVQYQDELSRYGYSYDDIYIMKEHYEHEVKRWQQEERRIRSETKVVHDILGQIEVMRNQEKEKELKNQDVKDKELEKQPR